MPSALDQFASDGFLVLNGFYRDEQLDRVSSLIAQRKRERPLNVVVDMLDTGERTALGLLSPEEIETRRMKISDLYLDMPDIRQLALSSELLSVLTELLGHVPVLCNSLYLEKGSAQPPHVDALYMTPRSEEHLIASWVALEDSHPDAGPLEYFPGSHRLPQMIFSNGTRHFEPDEMPKWEAYMADQVKNAGLAKKSFSAKKGDVLIWHSNLLHGGGQINNPELTRKSLVFHYYSKTDAQAQRCTLEHLNRAFWMNRPPHPLPAAVAQKLLFNEQAYLARYPDVADAVAAGGFKSGMQHYELFGMREGRNPA
ncbi:MAG: phytanoyl-CoA dioxygenase family protein [Pseudomonadota bacterium]